MSKYIAVAWEEDKNHEPSAHPAFRCSVPLLVLPNGNIKRILHFPTASWVCKTKGTQKEWAQDKLYHLRTFGVTGEIVPADAS